MFGAITMPKLQIFQLFHVTEVNYYLNSWIWLKFPVRAFYLKLKYWKQTYMLRNSLLASITAVIFKFSFLCI